MLIRGVLPLSGIEAMSYNILQAYKEQQEQNKPQPKPKKRFKPKKCSDCVYSRAYDSQFDYEVMTGRLFCRKWQTIVTTGKAKFCEYYEENSS